MPAAVAFTATLYSQVATPADIDAPVTVTVFVVVDMADGLMVGFCETINPPGQVVIKLLFVSTTKPDGSVSTKPRPDFAVLPGAFVNVKMSVPTCPTAKVFGSNLFVRIGITVYSASITPFVPAVSVLTFETREVTAVVASVVVLLASVSVFPAVTTDFVTAAVGTSLKRTA